MHLVLFIFCLVEQEWKVRPSIYIFFFQFQLHHPANKIMMFLLCIKKYSQIFCIKPYIFFSTDLELYSKRTKRAVATFVQTRVQWWRKIQKTTLYSFELSLCCVSKSIQKLDPVCFYKKGFGHSHLNLCGWYGIRICCWCPDIFAIFHLKFIQVPLYFGF